MRCGRCGITILTASEESHSVLAFPRVDEIQADKDVGHLSYFCLLRDISEPHTCDDGPHANKEIEGWPLSSAFAANLDCCKKRCENTPKCCGFTFNSDALLVDNRYVQGTKVCNCLLFSKVKELEDRRERTSYRCEKNTDNSTDVTIPRMFAFLLLLHFSFKF